MIYPDESLARIHRSIERAHESSTEKKMTDVYRRMADRTNAARRGEDHDEDRHRKPLRHR